MKIKNLQILTLLSLITVSTISHNMFAMHTQLTLQELEKKKLEELKQLKEKKQKEKRTLKQTWSKVVRLKWAELDKKDAWNIFVTTATAGGVLGGGYVIYRSVCNYSRIPLDPSVQITPDEEYHPNTTQGLNVRSDWELNRRISNDRIACPACLDDFVPIRRYRLDCGHYDTCGNCLRALVREQASQGNIARIRCPHSSHYGDECSHFITPSEIRQLAVDPERDRDLIGHVEQAIINRQRIELLQTVPDLKACHNCDALFIDRGRNMIHCPSCNAEYCAHCRADRTVCNGEVWRCANPSFGQGNNALVKMCPRCAQPIQRTDGCNHMTCERCYYGFCWTCLEPNDGWRTACQSGHCATLPHATVWPRSFW